MLPQHNLEGGLGCTARQGVERSKSTAGFAVQPHAASSHHKIWVKVTQQGKVCSISPLLSLLCDPMLPHHTLEGGLGSTARHESSVRCCAIHTHTHIHNAAAVYSSRILSLGALATDYSSTCPS